MPIERTRGESLEGVPTQPGQQPGRIGAKTVTRNRWSTPSASAGSGGHLTAARNPAWAGRAGGRS
jgi:hypothetical protein